MKPPKSKHKVLFIFPSFNNNEATHYPYWYELINEAAKKLDAVILFESGRGKSNLKHVKQVLIQQITIKPFNLIERFYQIVKFINQGYNKIYIHYSFWSLFITKLISFFSPLTIYYWNCEKYTTKPADKLLPMALKWCDVLVTGSQSIANSYCKVFKLKNKNIKIVPNWAKKFNVKPQKLFKGKIHILFIHHLSPRKGSRELPAVIRKTVNKIPNAHFHIIGSGPDENYLKSQNLPNVTFYGKLSLKKVHAFYKAADYFIMPSRAEGFPRVILEAMLYKLPFVATDVGNVSEIASTQQKQFLVKPNSPKKFSDKLIQLINLKDKHALINHNYQKAQKFNKQTATKALINALSD